MGQLSITIMSSLQAGRQVSWGFKNILLIEAPEACLAYGSFY